MRPTPEGRERWARLQSALEGFLNELLASERANRLGPPELVPPAPGIYLFVDEGVPIYVGQSRNIRNRLGQHCRSSSGHLSAPLAFNIARDQLSRRKSFEGRTRSEIETDPAFSKAFRQAKAKLNEMEVRCKVCDDPELRTVLEVFIALNLPTRYNSFETH